MDTASGEGPAGFPSTDGALEFGWDKPISQRKRKAESKQKAKPGSFGKPCMHGSRRRFAQQQSSPIQQVQFGTKCILDHISPPPPPVAGPPEQTTLITLQSARQSSL